MNSLLSALALAICVAIGLLVPQFGASAVVVCAVTAIGIGVLISRSEQDAEFLLRLFISGLLIRMVIGTIIFYFELQEFFGGDALTYDFFGYAQMKAWEGDDYYQMLVDLFNGGKGMGSGWGMTYLVAAIYYLVGRNMLAVQFFNAVIGAATAPILYLCAMQIYSHRKVARIAASFVAFFPSLILWSSQGLKDGPTVFLLALSMLATLKLGQKLDVKFLLLLIVALFGVLSMRFYIFYMLVVSVAGAFVVGMRAFSAVNFVRQFIVIIALGLAFTYLGVGRYATAQFDTYGSLDQIQRSREDMAGAGSGFAKEVDVSTASGAITIIPQGLVYLLFAPFPWQLASLRQSITLPEMLVWWTSFPLLMLGLWFTVKYRLRQASPVLIFTTMLTLSYSVFQGNIGTAYRQRAQLLVLYFIFVAAGIIIMKERREDKKRQDQAAREADTVQRAAAASATTSPAFQHRSASNI